MGILKKAWEASGRTVSWRAVMFTYVCIFLAIAFSSYLNTSERNRALSDFCLVQEQRHAEQVIQLKRTYNYLDQLTPEQRSDPNTINPIIIANLSNQEAETKADVAPITCDDTYSTGLLGLGSEKDYGNPEPDPEIPERPSSLKTL